MLLLLAMKFHEVHVQQLYRPESLVVVIVVYIAVKHAIVRIVPYATVYQHKWNTLLMVGSVIIIVYGKTPITGRIYAHIMVRLG